METFLEHPYLLFLALLVEQLRWPLTIGLVATAAIKAIRDAEVTAKVLKQ